MKNIKTSITYLIKKGICLLIVLVILVIIDNFMKAVC